MFDAEAEEALVDPVLEVLHIAVPLLLEGLFCFRASEEKCEMGGRRRRGGVRADERVRMRVKVRHRFFLSTVVFMAAFLAFTSSL